MNKKQVFRTGLILGLALSPFLIYSSGIALGITGAMSTGFLGSLLLYLYRDSDYLSRQTALEFDELLEGEDIVKSFHANLVVKPKEFGLGKFPFDDLLWTVGMKDKEAIGGKVHLTNYRLIFKSHKHNRLRGKVSIFLSTIADITDSSYFVTKKATVKTASSKLDLVIFEIEELIELIDKQQQVFNAQMIETLKEEISKQPAKICDGLEKWKALEVLSNMALAGKIIEETGKFAVNPLEALGGIFLKEFVDSTVIDKWQQKFE